jgi:hypothetical protein
MDEKYLTQIHHRSANINWIADVTRRACTIWSMHFGLTFGRFSANILNLARIMTVALVAGFSSDTIVFGYT